MVSGEGTYQRGVSSIDVIVSMEPQIGIRGRCRRNYGKVQRDPYVSMEPQIGIRGRAAVFVNRTWRDGAVSMEPQIGIRGRGALAEQGVAVRLGFNGAPDRYPGKAG